MTYAAYDHSPSLGLPVELFEFKMENTYYRYAGSDSLDTVTSSGSVTWTPARISRGQFSTGVELEQAEIAVLADKSLPIVAQFSSGFPESLVELCIYRMHLTDPDQEVRLIWNGEIDMLSYKNKSIEFHGAVPETSLRSLGLRRRYQKTCCAPLYKAGCNVDKALHSADTTVVSVSGRDVTVGIADCSSYTGGFFTSVYGGYTRTRYIYEGSGDVLTLKQEADWLSPGSALKVYKGCDKTPETCEDRFDNLLNFRAFPFMPEDNLFQSQVF